MPAMAFFGGLGDLLVSGLAAECTSIECVEIAVGLNSWRPTSGTRLTGAKNTYPRMIVRDGGLAPAPVTPPLSRWTFPQPFGEQPVTSVPLSEIVLISRHLRASSVTSFMNLKPLEDLHDQNTPPPQAMDKRGRSGQAFVVDVRLKADHKEHRATASGHDIYAVSAPMVANACVTLLAKPRAAGVHAPGELFNPREFIAELSRDIDVNWNA